MKPISDLYPTRAPPTGPLNGIPDIDKAAETPIIATISGSIFFSAEMTVQTTCTLFLKPSGKSGLIGRSIRRDVSAIRPVSSVTV